jgi:quercetin dioxygenase-like cupin family protein
LRRIRGRRRNMSEKNVDKVNVEQAPQGQMGQIYLASGEMISMRLWDGEEPGEPKPEVTRPYETVGYVLEGRAELHLEGIVVELKTGDSWTVPKGATHTYRILETFTAVEATSPPAEVDDRDKP